MCICVLKQKNLLSGNIVHKQVVKTLHRKSYGIARLHLTKVIGNIVTVYFFYKFELRIGFRIYYLVNKPCFCKYQTEYVQNLMSNLIIAATHL